MFSLKKNFFSLKKKSVGNLLLIKKKLIFNIILFSSINCRWFFTVTLDFALVSSNFLSNFWINFGLYTLYINLNQDWEFLLSVLNVVNIFNKNSLPLQNNAAMVKPFGPQGRSFIYFAYLETFDAGTGDILFWTNNNYIQNQEKILSNFDWEIYNNLTVKAGFFQTLTDLYEFSDYAPYDVPFWLEWYINSNMEFLNSISLTYNLALIDLFESFYYEPFFFFWKKCRQNLSEFRYICLMRQRSLLFDNWLFESKIVWKDKDHIFPPLSHISYPGEFRTGFKIIWWIFDYKQINISSYYLQYDDIQTFAFDKNFLHLWNYWIGLTHEFNYFRSLRWSGTFNAFWDKLTTPWTFAHSKYYNMDSSYWTFYSWLVNFGFFPDSTMLVGHMNPSYDWWMSGFTWFFHFGHTYMDSNLSLECVWHQLSYHYWGDFDTLVEDYFNYQPIFCHDNLASIRVPIMMLLLWETYKSPKEMNMFIRDYNYVFKFKTLKPYWSITGEFLYEFEPIDRFSLIWDAQPVEQKLHSLERLVNLYYGYNISFGWANFPSWIAELNDAYIFYTNFKYDTSWDVMLEELEKKLIYSRSIYNNISKLSPSIYFNNNLIPDILKPTFHFLNEKYYDNSGYFYSVFGWTDDYWPFNMFNWSNNLQLFYIEVIPIPHYTWVVSIFGNKIFKWWLIDYAPDPEIFLRFKEAFKKSFYLGFKYQFIPPTIGLFLKNRDIWCTISGLGTPILEFWFTFYPLFWFFKDLYGKSWIDNFILYPIKGFKHVFYHGFHFFSNFTNYRINLLLNKFNNFIYTNFSFINFNIIFDFFKIFFSKIPFFFQNIITFLPFYYTQHWLPICSINVYHFSNPKFTISTLNFVDEKPRFLPKEFFYPLGILSINDNVKTCSHYYYSAEYRINPILLTGEEFLLTDMGKLKQLLDILGIYEINNTEHKINYSNEMVEILNLTNFTYLKLSWLEYDWYLNYVIKHNLFIK